jgi:Ca2+-binding EF-hand superfamily protein
MHISIHKQVLSHRMTPEQALKEFLDNFDINNSKIDINSFINYYTNICNDIDNHEYFETLIRNTWKLNKKEAVEIKTDNRFHLIKNQKAKVYTHVYLHNIYMYIYLHVYMCI